MKRTFFAASLVLLGVSLAGCHNGGSSSGGSTTVTTPTPPKFSDQFGTNFSSTFQASNDTDPKVVASTDLTVNPSAEPVAIPANPTQ